MENADEIKAFTNECLEKIKHENVDSEYPTMSYMYKLFNDAEDDYTDKFNELKREIDKMKAQRDTCDLDNQRIEANKDLRLEEFKEMVKTSLKENKDAVEQSRIYVSRDIYNITHCEIPQAINNYEKKKNKEYALLAKKALSVIVCFIGGLVLGRIV